MRFYSTVSAAALIAGLLVASPALASEPACGPMTTSCTISDQTMGDTPSSAVADHSVASTSQAGNATGSVASGVTIAPEIDNSAQTTQNATTKTGDVGSDANANAHGNVSNNDNKSSVGPVSTGTNAMGDMTGTVKGSNASENNVKGSNTGVNASENTVKGSNTGVNTGTNLSANEVKGTQKVSNGSESGSVSSSGANKLSTTSLAKGGDQTLTNDGSGNSKTNVDASTKSNYKTLFIPSVIPGTPSSTVAVGNIIKETTACGPLQAVVKTPIVGVFNGLIRSSNVQQGYTYDLAPYVDARGAVQDRHIVVGADGVTRALGHQAVIFATVVGVSGNRNIALGGGGNEGAWGQGGMGSSAAMTQLVTSIQLKSCELGTYERVPVTPVIPSFPAPKHPRG